MRARGTYSVSINEDAQIVITVHTASAGGVEVILDPIVISRADSLKIANYITEMREKERNEERLTEANGAEP